MAVKFATVGEAPEQNDWDEEPVGAMGFTVNELLVPVFVDPVTIKVRPVPILVGVTVIPVNCPDEKVDDVPVIPAVPL